MIFDRLRIGKLRRSVEERRLRTELAVYADLDRLYAARESLWQRDRIYQDRDPGNWRTIGGDPTLPAGASDDREKVRKLSRRGYRENPHVGGIIDAVVNHVAGRGLRVTINSDPENAKVRQAARDWWAEWEFGNAWSLQCQECVRRGERDGEAFVRFVGAAVTAAVQPGRPTVRAVPAEPGLRFIDPEHIQQPENVPNAKDGIETESGDPARRLAYFFRAKADARQLDRIPAADILHVRIGVDQNERRGWPRLTRVLIRLSRYDDWLQDRAILNRARAAIAMLRQHKASPTDIAAFADTRQSGTTTGIDTDGNQVSWRRGQYPPGSILDIGADDNYQFPSQNIGASDARHDGRAILLSAGVGTGLPEYIVTGDASNTNFASALVAESPGLVTLGAIQDFYAHHFLMMHRRILEAGVPEAAGATWSEILLPSLTFRDELKLAQAVQILVQEGLMSRASAQARCGLDPEAEDESIAGDETEPETVVTKPTKRPAEEPKEAEGGGEEEAA